jgi:c-di-GMP-binding flagellar brake protein YcgR
LTPSQKLDRFVFVEKVEKKTTLRYGIVNIERRKYPRFSIDLPIEYYQMDSPVPHAGRAINSSEGGLLVYFSEPIEIGQHLKLKLFFSSESELNTLEALVEVVWRDIHLDKEWGDYRSGVRFLDISSEDLNKLKKFLSHLAGE